MVLDLPGGLFGQDDVRETATTVTGTAFWTTSGNSFYPVSETPSYTRVSSGRIVNNTASVIYFVEVNLPNNAVVTAAIGYGSETDENWFLKRVLLSDGTTTDTLATAVFGTEDTAISNPTIDNENYAYFINTGTLDSSDEIFGMRITYTT